MAIFNASGHCWRHTDCFVSFHKVVIREIQRNCSLKVLELFAESIREASQTTAMRPQHVILLFNVRCRNPGHRRQDRLLLVFTPAAWARADAKEKLPDLAA
jgi:hypothetical protein